MEASYLKKGDMIGITCPAGYLTAEKSVACIQTLQSWGYEVMVGKTLGSNSSNYFSATDDERLAELQAMLDDKTIKAILFGRGGYGMSRIIDRLNFSTFKKKPKWLIGFSDITVMLSHVFTRYNIACLHAPMASAFNGEENKNEYILSLKHALEGRKAAYHAPVSSYNRHGKTTATLVGGNLSLLVNCIGTTSDIDPKNNILFIEDTGEYLYSTDRMLYQLKRSGKLKKLAGLIVGGFTDMKDTERPFGKNIYELISDVVREYDYPVAFDFPVSHGTENYALKVGGTYRLSVTGKKVRLKEM